MVADFHKTPIERKVEEDERIRTMINKGTIELAICNVASGSLAIDNKKGRACDHKTGADVVKRLRAVRMRCHTSGVLMSAKSGWNKVNKYIYIYTPIILV